MIILGINYFYHDTAACLVRDGELVSMVEEERLSRVKHTWSFPHAAIERVLSEAGVAHAEVDHVAVSIDPLADWQRKLAFAPRLGRGVVPFARHEVLRARSRQRELGAWLRSAFGEGRRPRLHRVRHHVAHVAGSFLVSPYERAALLSIDGAGEWSTTWLGEAEGASFRRFSESYFPHSLGAFYESATEHCGFRPNYDEGKTMGLAPLGDPERYHAEMSPLVSVDGDGRVGVDTSFFRYQSWGHQRCGPKYHAAFGSPRAPDAPIEQRHMDVAAAAQRVLEERVLEMCRVLEERSTADHLVIAGGVALNSVMNGRILRETRFEDLYVMPAAGDNGTSIGAAYYVHNQVLGAKDRHHLADPYLGPEYSGEQIEAVLKACKLPFRRAPDVCAEAARMLRSGKILAWFQGRMEIGPRALGNRSILCDPTLPHMKDKLNAEVKHREAFRPFAPAVVVERAAEYFDISVEAPFMLKVCPVRPEKRALLPAVTHADGSARLQTVRAETNPRFHRLITEFGALSGTPVLLNTSFNVMGEPMVESPIQAIRCFYGTGLDVLVLGDFVVEKSP